MNWKSIFNETLSIKIKVNDRVKHRSNNKLGTVFQTAQIQGVPSLSVRHDDGTETVLVAAEEYTKVRPMSLIWANRGESRVYNG